MARGVNKVIIVGHAGADPEVRSTSTGTTVTTLRVATTESWRDKQSGEQQERTEWHRVKFFGKLAEIAGEYLRKGSQVYIEGSIRTEKYTGQDNVERYSTDIIANEMQMLGGRPDGQSQSHQQRDAAPASQGGGGYQQQNDGNHGGGYQQNNGSRSGGYQQNNANQPQAIDQQAPPPPQNNAEWDAEVPF